MPNNSVDIGEIQQDESISELAVSDWAKNDLDGGQLEGIIEILVNKKIILVDEQ